MRIFVIVNAIGFAVLALLCTWLLAGVNPRRPWDAAAFALSPALLLTGLVNWDLIAVDVRGRRAVGVGPRPAAADRRADRARHGDQALPALPARRGAGALPAAAPLPDLRAGRRSGRRGAWLLANLPALLTGPSQWKVFWTFNSDRGADLGSIWLVVQQAMDTTADPFAFDPHTINVGVLAVLRRRGASASRRSG